MPSFFRRILPAFIAVFAFSLTLVLIELGCRYINQKDPGKFLRHAPHSDRAITAFSYRGLATFDQGRKGELSRLLIQLGLEELGPLPRNYSKALQLEPGAGVLGKNFLMLDPDTIRPGIDDSYTMVGKHSGKTKYRYHLVTDENFRRSTGSKLNLSRKNLVLLGCSFTFGEGINNEETFAARLGKLLPVNSFNLGVPGGHAGMTLSNLKKEGEFLLKGLAETQTIMVYTFLNDHVSRTNGTSRYFFQSSYYYLPGTQYELQNGRLRSYPRSEAAFSDLLWFRFWLSELAFPKTFALEFPPIGETELNVMAKVLAEIKSESKRLLRHDVKLIVSFYPGEKYFAEKLIPYLESEGISYFDYSEINPNIFGGHEILPGDSHPSAEMNRIYAGLLAHDLEKELR